MGNITASNIFNTLFILNMIFAILLIITERKNPATTWSWLLVVFFIPVFGFVIYLFIGLDVTKRRYFIEKTAEDKKLFDKYVYEIEGFNDDNIIENQKTFISEHKQSIKENMKIYRNEYEFEFLSELVYLNTSSGGWLTSDNSVEVIGDGYTKFSEFLLDIRNAKKFVHVLYYIIRADILGKQVVAELAAASKRGVEVKFLYDGTGNNFLPRDFFEPIEKSGGLTAAFMPPLISRINFRNHRKITVIDGQIGYLGGFNIGDEYIGIEPKFGPWRDTHLRIMGKGVDHLELRFLMDWNFSSKHKILELNEYFPSKVSQGLSQINMQIVSSGPDTKLPNVQYGFFKMMAEANDKIYIATPYFVPDDSILEALRIAALSGLDVRIIIPGNPDHPFVYWASLSYLGELIDAGVRCYRYETGFLHSKIMLVDGLISTVGTANMDIRSFKLNFEVNSFIYDKDITETLEKGFFVDLENSSEITAEIYAKRNNFTKFRESIARLISPLL